MADVVKEIFLSALWCNVSYILYEAILMKHPQTPNQRLIQTCHNAACQIIPFEGDAAFHSYFGEKL